MKLKLVILVVGNQPNLQAFNGTPLEHHSHVMCWTWVFEHGAYSDSSAAFLSVSWGYLPSPTSALCACSTWLLILLPQPVCNIFLPLASFADTVGLGWFVLGFFVWLFFFFGLQKAEICYNIYFLEKKKRSALACKPFQEVAIIRAPLLTTYPPSPQRPRSFVFQSYFILTSLFTWKMTAGEKHWLLNLSSR